MKKMTYHDGSYVLHGIVGNSWTGKISAWYEADGTLRDAERIQGNKVFPVKEGGPIWTRLENIGAVYADEGERPRMKNPASSRKENYNDFDEWETDVFRAGATQVIRLGEDLFSAIKMRDGSLVKLDEEGFVDMRSRAGQKVRRESVTVGAWYGDRGEIYRQTIKNNPVTRRKGESVRDFTSRCMSEEKESFPKTKQRIAVCLSKSRKRNPVYDTGSDEYTPVYE